MREEVLRMERVTFQEQGVVRLENFSMTIWAGEIMGLVPANHYGLAAMIKLLQQNLPLHYGYIYYRERLVNDWRHSSMGMNRISVIQNKSCLAEDLTVADNIFVLRHGFRKRVIKPGLLKRQLEPFLQDIGVEIEAGELVGKLSVFEKFVVELLKAVVAGHRLVVLEDISTFISDAELARLHGILRHYAAQGMSFLYVASHFEEVSQICDRTALMMNGQITKIFQACDVAPDVFLISCTEDFERLILEQTARQPRQKEAAGLAFQAVDLCCGAVRHLSFDVAFGECLVLQDLDNCIFQDMIEMLSGDKRQESGELLVAGEAFCRKKRREIAVIQELPVETMLFENLSYAENLCFNLDHRLPGVWRSGRIRRSLREEYGKTLGEEVFDQRVEDLTEEEKYDLIYYKIMLQHPRVVFCVQPFKRADVSLRLHIWELLGMLLDKGIAVVILAVNLADSLALADRLIRIRRSSVKQKTQNVGEEGLEEAVVEAIEAVEIEAVEIEAVEIEAVEYEKKDFGKLQITAPWLYLYQDRNGEK